MNEDKDMLGQLDKSIEEARSVEDLGQSLERLSNNPDFKRVILKGYFEKEAIRLVNLKADPNMQTPQRQAAILVQIDAIGNLHQYFQTIQQMATMATKSRLDSEQMREELIGGGQ